MNNSLKAKRYSTLKYILATINVIYLLAFLLVFVSSGLSKNLAQKIFSLTTNQYTVVAVYLLITSVSYYLIYFPLTFYFSYILEHKFSLSRQKIKDWLIDQIKTSAIRYVIVVISVCTFYYLLDKYIYSWWWIISLIWIFFNLILVKLAPIIITPLFFKYNKLTDKVLRKQILNLADKMKIKILDVYQINFSKKTLKAKAAFVGMGNTKRVILSDTLRGKYSNDEIHIILAHEFAHYKLRHVLKGFLVNSLVIILVFYFIFLSSDYVLQLFALDSLSDVAALPIIFIYLIIFKIVIQPFSNYISRNFERDADVLALKITGLKEAFISTMEKLCAQNLIDRKPRPIVKFLFFRHPSIDERIATAELQ